MIPAKCQHYPTVEKKYYIHNLFFLLVFILLSCTPSKKFLLEKSKSIGVDNLYIRVLLKKQNDRILISSRSRIRITDINSRAIKYDSNGKQIYFYPEKTIKPILIESLGTPILVDNKSYRGMIELHNNLGKIYVINVLKINEYLYSVVPSEIPCSWEMEALKAQAVAARTYTYYHIMNNKKSIYDLDATVKFQVYNGLAVEDEKSNMAVDETSGKTVIYNSKPIQAFFHSTCGGRTIDDKHIWNGNDKPYLNAVKCGFCNNSPKFEWKERIGLYEIRQNLKKRYKGIGKISGITLRRQGQRVAFVIIRHKNGVTKLSGNDFRLLFPQNKIKSMFFRTTKTKDGLILHGYGWGHGVGMCQWGAKGMDEKGAGYQDILKYYYKGIRIINTKEKKYARR